MEEQNIMIPKKEYIMLKRKAKIADGALIQLKLSLEDMRNGKVSKF